jgi:hypothetical protein
MFDSYSRLVVPETERPMPQCDLEPPMAEALCHELRELRAIVEGLMCMRQCRAMGAARLDNSANGGA